jgi:type VII secretion-associated serine protease mycosin
LTGVRVAGCAAACAILLALVTGTGAAERTPARGGPAQAPAAVAFDRGTLLVRFRDGAGTVGASAASAAAGASIAADVPGTSYVVVRTGGRDPVAVRRELAADPRVAAVELNRVRRIAAVPDDPLFRSRQPYLRALQLPRAWSVTRGSRALRVAILDTGVDRDHPDLAPRLLRGAGFAGRRGGARDRHGHGTMVAGVAAGVTDNARGIAGAAWHASILPVRVLGRDGTGTDAEIAAGITWAADHGADVINLSLGGPGASGALDEAVRYALARDVVVVAAAGNRRSDERFFPAAFPGVLAVSATGPRGTFAWFSSYGGWVDVAAPGLDIAAPARTPGGRGRYARGRGTSFAAPLVSGVALLLRARHPDWTARMVVERLRATARDAGPPGFDRYYGSGGVDAYAALGGAVRAPLRAPPDGHEANERPREATPIAAAARGTIAPEGDVDWFVREVRTAGRLIFTVKPPPFRRAKATNMDAVLEVYGPGWRLLARRDARGFGRPERVVVADAVPGRYFVRVTSDAGARSRGYKLTARRR